MGKSKDMCRGCRQDYYNQNKEAGCWSYETATIVTRMRIGVWQIPPYVWRPEKCLSCYSPERERMIPKDDCRVVMPKDKAEARP